MPNHVTTTIHMKGSQNDLNKLRRLVDTEEYPRKNSVETSAFDFEVIIPGGTASNKDWYNWRCENWGTKWNSYDANWSEDNTCVSFQTAWSMPYPLLQAVALMFPNITFVIGYADEDQGSNCGVMFLKNDYENTIDASGWGRDTAMPKPIALAFARTMWNDEIKTLTDWAEEQGYKSIAQAKKDYEGDDFFEFLRSSFVVKHPILKLAYLIANETILDIIKFLKQKNSIKFLKVDTLNTLIES